MRWCQGEIVRREVARPAMVRRETQGFTLIEVVIAVAVLVTVLAGMAGVWAMAAASTRVAREQTLAMQLARDKLEQLAALAWAVQPVGGVDVLASDVTTNVSRLPATTDGSGTRASPQDSLGASRATSTRLSRCAWPLARFGIIAARRRPLRAPLVAGAHWRRLVGDAAVPGARGHGVSRCDGLGGRVVAESSECGLVSAARR